MLPEERFVDQGPSFSGCRDFTGIQILLVLMVAQLQALD
jgi:hypothetical protein